MRTRSPLLGRGPLALLSAEIASSLGTQMTFLALPWFVLTTTGSTAKMTLVLAAELAPVALLGIPSGSVVARLGALRTMLLCDLVRAPLMAAIPVLHAVGALSFPVLLALVFALGCFLAPYFSAQRVAIPELLGEGEALVGQANAALEAGTRLTILLGPAAAGLLIAWLGATNVLYVDAASFALSFALLAVFVPRREPLPQSADSRGMLAGLRFLLGDRLLAPVLAAAVFLNFFGQGIVAALPALAYQDFDASSRTAGLFFAALGAGSLVGGIAAIAVVTRVEPMRLVTLGLVWLTLPRAVLAFELPAWGVAATLFVTSIAGPLVNAPLLTLLTTRTPGALRAKALTATVTVATLAGPLGLLLAGRGLEWADARVVLVVAALGQLPFALVFAALAARGTGRGPAAPVPEPA